MDHRHLGRSGLRVSRLGLGTMTWGTDTDEHEARDQMEAFLDAGGSLVDTAPIYGDGAAEALLGTMLDKLVAREDVVVATKAGVTATRDGDIADTSRRALLATLDASLARLGTDHVDLWQVQEPDPVTPLEETLAAIDHAVATGRVRYVGVTGHAGWQLAQAATWQRASPERAPVISVQAEFSLLARAADAEVLPAARALGVGVLSSSPLGRGVLTGKYRHGIPNGSRGAARHSRAFVAEYLHAEARRVVDAVATAAEGLDCSPLEISLAWVRDHPGVTAAVLGARTAAQLRASLRAEQRQLPAEIAQALAEVSDPHRGPEPEG